MYVSDFHFTGFVKITHKANYTKTHPVNYWDPLTVDTSFYLGHIFNS